MIELVDEEIIVNDDIFYACDEEINIKLEKYERLLEEEIIEESSTVYNGIGEVWILPTRSIYDKYDKYDKMDFDTYDEYENTNEKNIEYILILII